MILLSDSPVYTILAVSNDFVTTSGRSREEVIGKSHFEIFPENPSGSSSGVHSLKDSFNYILQHKTSHSLPLVRYDIPDGKGGFLEKYWKSTNAPVFNQKGEVAYVIHTSEDVTQQVVAEQTAEKHQELQRAYKKLEESQEELKQFKFMADNAQDPFILMREDGTFAYLNQKALDAWGYTAAEAKHIRVPDVDPIYQDEVFAEVFTRAQKEEVLQFETLYKRKDGLVYPVEVNMNGITLEGKPHLFAIARNITERKKGDEELRMSEDRFRTMVNAVPLSIWITDANGHVEFLNQHWCDYCGVPYSPTTAANIAVEHLHPEDGPKVMQAFTNAIQTGEPFEVEQRNRSKEGEYRWFLNRGTPYRDSSTGQITKWFGVGIDIHDRKLGEEALRHSEEALEKKVEERTLELEKANQDLKRSNANLEEFAYAASHDMKEPIRKIHFFAERLKVRLAHKMEEEDLRYFERLEMGAKRMNTLIDDLLLYSHVNRGVATIETVDLNQMLSFVLDDLELHIEEKGAKIEIGPMPTINGRPRQLQQLFENLIANALKYSKEGVKPLVSVSSQFISGGEASGHLPFVNMDNQYHLIEVRDNGIGFEQADAERIFNVFTRLHGNAEYRGTGVGLSIVQKIVENHKGHIWAESQPGEGATFNVLFPVK